MDLQNIIGLLQHDSRPLERTQFCPADQEIAQYYEAAMPIADCERLQRHILDCAYCEARLGALERLQETGFFPRVDEELIASAKQMAVTAGPQKNRRAPAWAAAAVVVIALFTIVGRDPNPGSGAIDQPPLTDVIGEPARVLRNIGPVDSGPTILTPIDGERIRPDELMVRWTQVPGSLYYDVRLVNAAGFIIWQDRVRDTRSILPPDLELVSGDRYFVRVDAYLAEAKSISSLHVKFIAESEN